MAAPTDCKVRECTPQNFHVKTKQSAVEVNGVRTELLCTKYDDHLFIIVTQYNKIGTLVNISRDSPVDDTGSSLPIYSTDVLLGKDEPMTHVIAKTLISKLVVQKPVLLSMALKDTTAPCVKALANLLPSLV